MTDTEPATASFPLWWDWDATSLQRDGLRRAAREFQAVPVDIEVVLLARGFDMATVWSSDTTDPRGYSRYVTRAMYETVLGEPFDLDVIGIRLLPPRPVINRSRQSRRRTSGAER